MCFTFLCILILYLLMQGYSSKDRKDNLFDDWDLSEARGSELSEVLVSLLFYSFFSSHSIATKNTGLVFSWTSNEFIGKKKNFVDRGIQEVLLIKILKGKKAKNKEQHMLLLVCCWYDLINAYFFLARLRLQDAVPFYPMISLIHVSLFCIRMQIKNIFPQIKIRVQCLRWFVISGIDLGHVWERQKRYSVLLKIFSFGFLSLFVNIILTLLD